MVRQVQAQARLREFLDGCWSAVSNRGRAFFTDTTENPR